MNGFAEQVNDRLDRLARVVSNEEPTIERLVEELRRPPRIVVIGRLKAGKSTLVNALIGAPVAETAALEATNVVTVYQHGAPDRAAATLRDGTVIPIETRRGEVAALPMDATEIEYVDRWMVSESLKSYTLIDTPGLATLTENNEATTRGALLLSLIHI